VFQYALVTIVNKKQKHPENTNIAALVGGNTTTEGFMEAVNTTINTIIIKL
jgi:hypothetical protein